MKIFRQTLYDLRSAVLNFKIVSNLLGISWWLLPNTLRLRLPIYGIAFGFITPFKTFKWVLDPRDLISQKYFSLGFRKYESLTQKALFKVCLEFNKQRNLHFLNIGANTGLYALLVGKKFPSAKITLIEPVPINHSILQKNMELNHLNPIIHNLAAGSKRSKARIYPHPNYFGMASFAKNQELPIEVEVFRTDEIVTDSVDIALIDVEGHEIEVLNGMKKILVQDGPILIIETSAKTLIDLTDFLKTYGYGDPDWLGKELIFGPQEKNFLYRKNI
jgi:FkbM family methyltransferase